MKWLIRKIKVFYFKIVLNRMIRAMEADGWDTEDICNVLLHIGDEVGLTPSVKERLNL